VIVARRHHFRKSWQSPDCGKQQLSRASPEATVVPIAAQTDQQLLLCVGAERDAKFLRNKNRFRESHRSNAFGLEGVCFQISPAGPRQSQDPADALSLV
jgi:hypothetical protein